MRLPMPVRKHLRVIWMRWKNDQIHGVIFFNYILCISKCF